MKQGRVLAVDDNITNLAAIEEALGDQFHLKLVQRPEDALGVATKFLPDVVLLDIMMPLINGYEVCAEFRKHPVLRYSQIIMVSAKSELNDRLSGYHVGADDYLVKPFDDVELLAKINAALRNKKDHEQALKELDSSQTSTIEVLTMLMRMRRAESQEHTDRIRVYSMLLASELFKGELKDQIIDEFIDSLYLSCALYDIGKLVLPDLILREFDPYTGAEHGRLRQHTKLGEQILLSLTFSNCIGNRLKSVAYIARNHHEKFDGSGYPDGLQGLEIPLAARIIAVADTFDLLTSGYMGAARLSPVSARDAILNGRETKFDPVIVDAFLSVYEEFVSLCECSDYAEGRESSHLHLVSSN